MLVPTGTSLAGYACDDALSQLATEFKSQTSEVKGKMGALEGITNEMKARLDRGEQLDKEFTQKL